MAESNEKFIQADEKLKKNLKFKGITVPVVFAIVIVVICIILSNSHIGLLPSGNHDDSLTTTQTTVKSEYDENEFKQNA